MTIKTRQSVFDWICSTLIILAAVAVVAVGSPKAAAAETAPMTYAQTQIKQKSPGVNPGRGGPGSLRGKGGGAEVACNGKTATQCCEGLMFCGCLYSPMPKKGDEDKPLACSSNPPPLPPS